MMDVMPLHLAIAWEQTDAAIWLLKHGANPIPKVQIRQQVLGLNFAPDTLSVLVFSSMFISEQRFYNELYWQLRKPAFLLRYGKLGKYKIDNGQASSSGRRFSISSNEGSPSSSSHTKQKMNRKVSVEFAERFRNIPPELFQTIVHFLA